MGEVDWVPRAHSSRTLAALSPAPGPRPPIGRSHGGFPNNLTQDIWSA